MFRSILFFISFSVFIVMNLSAQNLDRIGKEKPFEISGGASLNQMLYTAFGNQGRRDPYSFVAAANLNVGIYGWSIPVNVTLSDQGHSFQQPFNQYSIHPTYKAIRSHVGYISASYSPYSVNGHNFLGVALDVEPEGKFRMGALYGRFLKATRYDSLRQNSPTFKRMGMGVKTQYVTDKSTVLFTIFHAKDEDQFLGNIPDSLMLRPQENFVLSLSASTLLFSRIRISGEYAASAISSDISASIENRDHFLRHFSSLYTTRTSSSFYNARKINIDYQKQNYSIGVGFERIDPNYQTFASYFFNNDMENFTINASTSLIEGKISLTTSLGVQHDNLNKTKVSTLERSVGSININYSPTPLLTLSASYSSFQTFTNIQSQFHELNNLSPYQRLDTLNFTQLSRTAGLNGSLSFGHHPERKQAINVNASMQSASEEQADVLQNSGAQFYNVNTSYSLVLQPKGLSVSMAINGNINESHANKSLTYGPVASLSQYFFKKILRAMLTVNYLKTGDGDGRSGWTASSRIGASVKVKKQHNLTFNTAFLNKSVSEREMFRELTAMIGYSFSFSHSQDNRSR